MVSHSPRAQRDRRTVVLLVFTLLLGASACGGSASRSEGPASASQGVASGSEGSASASQGEASPTRSDGAAGHGEVCHAYDGSLDRPCAEGLSCCYPCGIDGCDSVCHTPEECDMDRMRPSAPPPP
jgi:hypothetical protein